ncbi:MAG: PorT family protein [Tannerellaceae bacterium]|jgi:hypothetical protein|nr:PorT family protein [Tannerellaceae bacterium]
MKHLVCTLFLLSAWALPADAQSFFLTPRAGINLATITQTDGRFKSGLNFGASGEYVLTPNLSTEVGLYYSMQGVEFPSKDVSPEHNYLNVPLLVKYYVKKGTSEGGNRLIFFAGPQLDIKALVNKVSYAHEYAGYLLSHDMSKPFGISAVIGAGYLFDVGLMLSANVNLGLTGIAKEKFENYGTFLTSNRTYKNLAIQFNFGYRFSVH